MKEETKEELWNIAGWVVSISIISGLVLVLGIAIFQVSCTINRLIHSLERVWGAWSITRTWVGVGILCLGLILALDYIQHRSIKTALTSWTGLFLLFWGSVLVAQEIGGMYHIPAEGVLFVMTIVLTMGAIVPPVLDFFCIDY